MMTAEKIQLWAFDQETEIREGPDGHLQAHVHRTWNIGGNPNGGYLAALVLAALTRNASHPDPASVTIHFLRPGIPDTDCHIAVETLRTGRTLSTSRATLKQEGKARLEVLAALTDLNESAGIEAPLTLAPPELPEPDACVPRTGDLQGIELPILDRLDVRLDPACAVPGGSPEPEIRGWIRFRDGRAPDSRALVLFADAFPPSPLVPLGVVGWVPTLELTVHVRRHPATGWIRAAFRTDDLSGGRMIETGALWDDKGHLVAQSRQLGLVLQRR